jgi:transposase, IS5 family
LRAEFQTDPLLDHAHGVRYQEQRQRGPKVYSHASEVECIGKGNARAPCEFVCNVSIATLAANSAPGISVN